VSAYLYVAQTWLYKERENVPEKVLSRMPR